MLDKQVFDDVTVDVGEAVAAALEEVGKAFVIDAELIENGGVEIVDSDFVADGLVGEVVGLAVIESGFEAAAGDENLKAGQDFLAANKGEEGVVETASGLQYRVDREGDGDSPDANDRVTVHYHGTLIDGTVFDSSYDRGQPATFGLNQVISGWTEGLQTMKKGGQTTFFIPSDLAYGPRATGDVIGANSTLIFKVELLEVEPVE